MTQTFSWKAFLVLGFILLMQNIFAATYTVSNQLDDGSTNTVANTICWAVNQANTQPGDPHIISLSNSITVFTRLTLTEASTDKFFLRNLVEVA